jgi:hypothetical protein
MKLALLAIGLLGLGIAGMAIKMFFGKGYLEKSCASASRLFDEDSDGSCKFCEQQKMRSAKVTKCLLLVSNFVSYFNRFIKKLFLRYFESYEQNI